MTRLLSLGAFGLAAALAGPAFAQSYPYSAPTILVPPGYPTILTPPAPHQPCYCVKAPCFCDAPGGWGGGWGGGWSGSWETPRPLPGRHQPPYGGGWSHPPHWSGGSWGGSWGQGVWDRPAPPPLWR